MIHYKRIVSRLLDQNIYVLYNDLNEAIIVDPGLGFDLIDNFLKNKNLTPIAIIGTHAHIDHIASASDCIKHYNIPFYICRGNSIMLEHYDIMKGKSRFCYFFMGRVEPNLYFSFSRSSSLTTIIDLQELKCIYIK